MTTSHRKRTPEALGLSAGKRRSAWRRLRRGFAALLSGFLFHLPGTVRGEVPEATPDGPTIEERVARVREQLPERRGGSESDAAVSRSKLAQWANWPNWNNWNNWNDWRDWLNWWNY